MGGPLPAVSPLPANRWIQALTGSLFLSVHGTFSVSHVTIQWQRASSSPPFYTWGTHDTSQPFGAVCFGVYTAFRMLSPVDNVVAWHTV